jgi:hypothetical protein
MSCEGVVTLFDEKSASLRSLKKGGGVIDSLTC